MASYQDLDSRLRALEDKLAFVMQNMRMRAAITSGVLDRDGRPIIQNTFEGTLLELYHLQNQMPLVKESDIAPSPEQ